MSGDLQPLMYGDVRPVYASGEASAASAAISRGVPDRPARVQVEQLRKLQQVEHLGEFNIWYGKYMGESNYEKAPKAATRVCIEADTGLTQADYTGNTAAHLCLHFARGCCVYGKDCTFRHCVPTEEDESQADTPHDIFGRNRHGSFRDDMGGTGTWNKECKTLYVGRICATPTEQRMTETVVRHMGEYGQLESARVLKSKGVAFVTYRLRCSAEFAKEAMAEQSLDHDEQINVRWAYDDPNPRAQAMRLRNSAQIMLAAMEAKGHLPSGDVGYPDEWDAADGDGDGDGEPDAKRQRAAELAPMTREEYATQQAEAEAELEAAAAAAAAEAERAAKQAEVEAAVNTASRLDAILNSIDRGGGSGCGSGGGRSGDEAGSGSGSRGGQQTEGDAMADPLAEFLQSVSGDTAAAPAAASAEARLALDDTVELPPGVHQPRGLPAGWHQYTSPEGWPYYVSPEGHSTWAMPQHEP